MTEQKTAFRPPVVLVSDRVQWFRTRSDAKQGLNPTAAIVTKHNGKSLGLWVIPQGFHNGYIKDVVLHADDPNIPANHEQDESKGFWRLVPTDSGDPQIASVREIQEGKTSAAINSVAGSIKTETPVSKTK